MKIHIGTSGWHYKHWKGRFYPEGLKESDQLDYYIQQGFKTVEINNSFYHLPDVKTFQQWQKKVPEGFIFSVKASRYITHMKKLKDSSEALTLFLERAKILRKNLGPILFQLPPGWKINVERLESFLKILPKEYRYAFEFRNATWYNEKVYQLLHDHHCAFCIYELNHHLSPIAITTDFIYIRLHGPGEKYQGNYTDSALKKWSKQLKHWTGQGKEIFVYFDNDQNAYAAFNAKKLNELVLSLES
jgi:uncharacterized protein YecE (DUF72 family)